MYVYCNAYIRFRLVRGDVAVVNILSLNKMAEVPPLTPPLPLLLLLSQAKINSLHAIVRTSASSFALMFFYLTG